MDWVKKTKTDHWCKQTYKDDVTEEHFTKNKDFEYIAEELMAFVNFKW